MLVQFVNAVPTPKGRAPNWHGKLFTSLQFSYLDVRLPEWD